MLRNTSQQRPDTVQPYVFVVTRVLPFVLLASVGAPLGLCAWLQAMPIA